MSSIKAVLFDLDNTILDRTRTFSNFTHAFISNYFRHIEFPQSIYETIIERDQDGYKDKNELFAELIDLLPWQARPRLEELMGFYGAEYVGNAIPMNRAREVVLELKKRYKTGLITNGKTAIQYGKIDRLGIRDDFDLILVSEEAGIKKPDPRIFELALERLRLQPEECVYVGDHPVNDMEGASQIGIGGIWMKVNQPWREELSARPLHTIRQLEELLTLL
ncbi:HAD family hydrolase [Cohnella phaseoli]|uniref:Putative hydrolase of the HAD superfamily n=1 Tax=Cohnella phaseoli TaxID=456490 RepID=A0A3D9KJ70_9BACL|nr:HAD family hydrolase [Cohnella phaseoli]RED86581.1 putative hydrolase of the HAD superfamily [Cohnella phaseoli]